MTQSKRKNLRRAALTLLASAVATLLLLLAGGEAYAHGYTNAPISRALYCQMGTARNCGPIQWEPQSVEGPKGFPNGGPSDGRLCSANLSQFGQLDDQRNGGWPANSVSGGSSYTIKWKLTAAHATTDFKYYLTKPGWNQTAKLTRSALNLTPIATFPYGGRQPPSSVSHTVTLPALSGRHMLYAVWTIADTGNAFYQCSDLQF
ncbi:chitin-binding protein [Actinorhabdospora filicis]|uniref:Chitin-binding protein n=1 Tax=Actinorhabdospora filicis TaxID=1785913 RepID=A0A9W6W7V3_9ACTN|nr:lytic polysaccharide monooxygenase auxiliary activity family 9 protein [Actinorhabdospora filicis]GLZ76313.1 chitin-binding protein [Actinorhabdospora filicis]